jgi:Type VI secretion system/phage-baseplate injector OB domain
MTETESADCTSKPEAAGEPPQKYFGKYRAVCVNNLDPLSMARIQVSVPDVTGSTPTTWAMPCVPVGGMSMGIVAVPPRGAGVWVEFEQGDPDYPIWVGCYWGGASELPSMAPKFPLPPTPITLQTRLGGSISVSNSPEKGITIKGGHGASVIINDTGIFIKNGKGATLTMVGPKVTVNSGALTVI